MPSAAAGGPPNRSALTRLLYNEIYGIVVTADASGAKRAETSGQSIIEGIDISASTWRLKEGGCCWRACGLPMLHSTSFPRTMSLAKGL